MQTLFELGEASQRAAAACACSNRPSRRKRASPPSRRPRFQRGRSAEFGARKLLAVLAVLGMEIDLIPAGQAGTLDELRRERSQP